MRDAAELSVETCTAVISRAVLSFAAIQSQLLHQSAGSAQKRRENRRGKGARLRNDDGEEEHGLHLNHDLAKMAIKSTPAAEHETENLLQPRKSSPVAHQLS